MTDEELDELTDKALELMRNDDTEHLSGEEWQALFMKKHDIVLTQYKKKDDKKMVEINVTLNESQLEELVQNVDIIDYVDYMHMIDWNDLMSSVPATEIIESIDLNNFDTGDEYAVLDGSGYLVTSDSLHEILEPFLDDMLQDYLDSNL